MGNRMLFEKPEMCLSPKDIKKIPGELRKTHGSKVKMGELQGCRISRFGAMSVILVDQDHLIPLTPLYVNSCRRIDEKFKPERMKKYYYYEITFHDGRWNRIRVSEKHLENLRTMEVPSIDLPDDKKVIVVCDGKAPYEAAKNLYHYISAATDYSAEFMKAEDYEKLTDYYVADPASKVIIVGHHSLAKDTLDWIGTQHDEFGMVYGFYDEICVLRASESKIKNEIGAFSIHYEDRVKSEELRELAAQYHIPDTAGFHDEIRKSQYHLLWLEFAVKGLPEFFELSGATAVAKIDKQRVRKELCQELTDTISYRKYIDSALLSKVCEVLRFYNTAFKLSGNDDKDWQELYRMEPDGWLVQRHKEKNYCRVLDEEGDTLGHGTVEQVICPILDYCHRQSKLVELTERNWGIVFCGGGARGAYQIGVWEWLVKHNLTERITGVSGASVGALNSLLFVSGDVEKAHQVWSEVAGEDIAYRRKGLRFSQRRLKSLIGKNVKSWEDIYQADKIVYSSLTGKNVPLPVSELIRHLRKGAIKKNRSIQSEYFCWASRKKEDIQELVLASAAIPLAFKAHRIEGKDFVDGGLADNMPARPLVEDGFRNIIVVHLRRKTPERERAFYRNLAGLDTSSVVFYHIWPSKELGNILEANKILAEGRIALGNSDAEQQLSVLQGMVD